MSAITTTPPTTPPAIAPEFTELDCFGSLDGVIEVIEGGVDDVMVAPLTRFCSKEAKVGSANPAAGIVDVAPPVGLIYKILAFCLLDSDCDYTHPPPILLYMTDGTS